MLMLGMSGGSGLQGRPKGGENPGADGGVPYGRVGGKGAGGLEVGRTSWSLLCQTFLCTFPQR